MGSKTSSEGLVFRVITCLHYNIHSSNDKSHSSIIILILIANVNDSINNMDI